MMTQAAIFSIEIQIHDNAVNAIGETLSGDTITLIECGTLNDLHALLQHSNGFQIQVDNEQVSLVRPLPAKAAHTLLTATLKHFKQPILD